MAMLNNQRVIAGKKYESQIGSSSQLLAKIEFRFQTTNQIPCGNENINHPFGNGYHWLMELRMDYCFTNITFKGNLKEIHL